MENTQVEFRIEDLVLEPAEGYKVDAVCDASTPGRVLMGVLQASAQYISEDTLGLNIQTTRGMVQGILTLAQGQPGVVIWIPGAGQNLNGPADGVFADLSGELKAAGVTSLRIAHREPGNAHESVLDVLASIAFLKGLGGKEFVVAGVSYGAAVAISVAAIEPLVKGVAALIVTPEGGTELVDKVSPKPILIAHGALDTRIDVSVAEELFSRAKEPKELVIFPNGGYALVECKDELKQKLGIWLMEQFGKVDEYIDSLEAQADEFGDISRLVPGPAGQQRELILTRDDIVFMDTDAIVSTTGTWLDLPHTALAKKVVEEGGWHIQEELWKQAPLVVTDVGITSAGGNLKAKHVFHAITGGEGASDEPQSREEIVAETTENCLNTAVEMRLKTLALPAIGAGARGLPPEIGARIMVSTIVNHLAGDTSLEKVVLSMVTDATYRAFASQLKMIQESV